MLVLLLQACYLVDLLGDLGPVVISELKDHAVLLLDDAVNLLDLPSLHLEAVRQELLLALGLHEAT